jgi:hypothetical protein
MKKFLVASILAVMTTSAHAWGAVEQAALAAIVGGFFVGRATAEPAPPPPVYYVPRQAPSVHYHYSYQPPVVQYHAPRRVCQSVPLFDAYGRYVSSRRVCSNAYH